MEYVKQKSVLIDADQLLALRELNDPGKQDLVTELIDIFLEQSPSLLVQLKEQIDGQNKLFIKKLAHKLKGSGANLGAKTLRDLCQNLEDQVYELSLSEMHTLFRQIESSFHKSCEVLKKEWRITLA